MRLFKKRSDKPVNNNVNVIEDISINTGNTELPTRKPNLETTMEIKRNVELSTTMKISSHRNTGNIKLSKTDEHKVSDKKRNTGNIKLSNTGETKLSNTDELKVSEKKRNTGNIKLPSRNNQSEEIFNTSTIRIKSEDEAIDSDEPLISFDDDLSVSTEGIKSSLEIEKEKALAERNADRSHKDEQTNLTEDELAKTTLIDGEEDMEELFRHEIGRHKKG